MKIKSVLLLLCLVMCRMAYAQLPVQAADNGDEPQENGLLHKAPPRKEIRHLIKADGSLSAQSALATRATGEYIMTEFPTTGEIRGVVLLAAFSDVPFSSDSAAIKSLLSKRYNADNYTEDVSFTEYSNVYGQSLSLRATIPGSARDYFRDQSFGLFTPSFDVIGPVTLDRPRAYYGANNSAGDDKNTAAMIRDACEKAYDLGLTDFADYDNDADGIVDFVYIVYAGSDEAQTYIEDCVWAKASSISLTLGNGMKISRYACSGELVIDLPVTAGIGTFVHEFGHVLGLPDFYNTLDTDFTMDTWSVMDYGCYNAEGFVPCGYTSFERYSLGWIPMTTLDAPATMSMGTTDEERQGYRIFTSEIDSSNILTEADTASFYLLETIRREGWNRYAAANGLLVSQVTYKASAWKNNKVNVEDAHRYYVVPANNDYNYLTANEHLFGTTNHEFTLTSTPASISQFGAAMDKPLTDIRYDAATGRTSFHFRGGNGIGEWPDVICVPSVKYDLHGRPLYEPAQGFYIQNGIKYYQK